LNSGLWGLALQTRPLSSGQVQELGSQKVAAYYYQHPQIFVVVKQVQVVASQLRMALADL